MLVRRSIRGFIATTLVATGIWLAAMVLDNNRNLPSPPDQMVDAALERAIGWVSSHHDEVLDDGNAVIWWMLAQATRELPGDERLASLVRQFKSRWIAPGSPIAIWRPLFEAGTPLPFGAGMDASTLPPYNQYFLYGLTCDSALRLAAAVQEELHLGFCPALWPTAPHCATHQAMGTLWGLSRGCTGTNTELAVQLLDRVRRELRLDFRVDDAYLQRALLLAMASPTPRETLRGRWLLRILAKQLPDGGWDGNPYRLRPRGSSLHATAQGILLLARYRSSRSAPDAGPGMEADWPVILQ